MFPVSTEFADDRPGHIVMQAPALVLEEDRDHAAPSGIIASGQAIARTNARPTDSR
jgi:hypothetical protein